MTIPTTMCDGRQVDLMNPKPDDFGPEQIATHLSRIPRFLGATRRHYSVLEHSVLGCEYIRRSNLFEGRSGKIARAFLLHDAHEAVIGDFPEPLTTNVPGFRELVDPIKRRIDFAIQIRFNVDLTSAEAVGAVKYVDHLMLQREWVDLMPTEWYREDLIRDQGDNAPEPIQKHAPHATLSQMIGQFCHLLRVTEHV